MAKPATKSTALWVTRRLHGAGFQALLAGGCVRDMLLGRRCTDYDVATDATPRQVRRLFDHVLLIGAKFGVAMVIHRGRKVEVSTFRTDLSYSDGRRPDGVRFSTPREDALRRDFTINGMFYDPLADEVIDYVGGRRDLDRGVIRTIGRPADRLAEDYLRMLRAVRISVRLGFAMASATAAAVRRNARNLSAISGERIFDELTKMLSCPLAPEALRQMHDLGLAPVILEELFADPGHWDRASRRVASVARRRDLLLTLGALLADVPAGSIRKRIRRWGASNELRDGLCFLVGNLPLWRQAAEMPLCDFKRLMVGAQWRRLRVLWRVQERMESGGQRHSRRIARRVAGIDAKRLSPAPLVTGADLLEMGLPEGKRVGQILRSLYDAQLNEQIESRTEAMKLARAAVHRSSAP